MVCLTRKKNDTKVIKDALKVLGKEKEEINIQESQLGTTMSFKEILEKAKIMKQKK